MKRPLGLVPPSKNLRLKKKKKNQSERKDLYSFLKVGAKP